MAIALDSLLTQPPTPHFGYDLPDHCLECLFTGLQRGSRDRNIPPTQSSEFPNYDIAFVHHFAIVPAPHEEEVRD